MRRSVGVALVQHPASSTRGHEELAAQLRELTVAHPATTLWVYPELHLDSPKPHPPIENLARDLDEDPALLALGALAQELGIWLVPGTVYERAADGRVYNTALVYSPDGERVASYRKIFPWRPDETSSVGTSFEVVDLPGIGKIGLSICYDIWFPEHTRHLAWGGAELVLNLVQTATSDREQELAIVRGNAVMNQVWIASLNAAAPTGRGRSLVVDPNGAVRASSPDASAEVLTAVVDLGQVAEVREFGTAGVSRPWSQFREGDPTIPLPLYGGSITPSTWEPGFPQASTPESTETRA
ncbi:MULTISPECIES: carbon-nitrogen hydrolase family protein [unclassified Leucobacter]|uniref:carbon-nitrogen hydrolase family protein n=1 Tax=unclassified Leucobacter TaxID=2621730 RepID=UPI00165D79C3|nr:MULTISPECIES: carbon-nitrogen hydrolase family protein [unclassified Leucobacter]MBC9937675.1 carbon-nitrogen hydrolase family protein [Leucobacter sp. cx-87]